MKKVIFLLVIFLSSTYFATAQENQSTEKNKEKFGLIVDNLTADQKAFNAETKGIVIIKVLNEGAGKTAGASVGDIITHIDAIAITNLEHYATVMQNFDTSKGAAKFKIIRNGVKMDLKVVL